MRISWNILIFVLILLIGIGHTQEFYKSEGLRLFNQGEYRAAVDSMAAWIGAHTAEAGIAYYYIGQSYYNLGLDDLSSSRSESYLRQSINFFDRALKQADLSTAVEGLGDRISKRIIIPI